MEDVYKHVGGKPGRHRKKQEQVAEEGKEIKNLK